MFKNSIKILTILVIALSFTGLYAQDSVFRLADYPKNFSAGWNLVALDYIDPLLETGHVKFAYALDPRTQEYVGGDVLNNAQDRDEFEALSDWFDSIHYTRASYFVYLDASVNKIVGKSLNRGLEESLDSFTLFEGWNAIVYPKDFAGRNINDFIGTCQIEKVYTFSAEANSWYDLHDFLFQPTLDLNYDDVGMGLVIKVSDECSFNFSKDNAIPALPKMP